MSNEDPKKNKLDITSPLGLNLNDFANNNGFNIMNSTIHKISQKNDAPIIKELTADHKSIKEILTKRKAALQNLSTLWKKGNINEDDIVNFCSQLNIPCAPCEAKFLIFFYFDI